MVEVQEARNILCRKGTRPRWGLKLDNERLYGSQRLVLSSLKENIMPVDWKCANIVPIYKKGKKEEPMNYKLVSLTNVVAKLCRTDG